MKICFLFHFIPIDHSKCYTLNLTKKKKSNKRRPADELLSLEELSRASGKTRCHGDLVPVAVEMLMKALALGPRRDQRHPGPRCPPDRRDYVSGATANVARVIEFACVLKSGVTKRSTSNVFNGHGTRREHKAV